MRDAPVNPADQIVLLGLDEQDSHASASPRLLAALCSYAQARLASGVGIDRLAVAGIALPALRELYQLGYIPPDYRTALHPDDAQALAGFDLADAIAIPAFDGAGALTDLCCWRLGTTIPTWIRSLAPEPAGILAPRLAQVAGELVLVDSLDRLAARMASGVKQAFLLRHDVALAAQVKHLAVAGGERRVRIEVGEDPDGVREACRSTGLIIIGEGLPIPWQLREHSREYHNAIFSAGDLVATIATPWQGTSKLHVEVRCADGRRYGERTDIAVPRQNGVFSSVCARTLHLDPAQINALLTPDLLHRLERIESGDLHASAAEASTEPARSTSATGAVRVDEDPVARFHADTDALGWLGDARAKTLSLLTLAGSGLAHPPWLILRGPATTTLPVMGLLGEMADATFRLALDRTNDGSLARLDPDGLRHRLITIDAVEGLHASALSTLTVLGARGGFTVIASQRNAATGRMRQRAVEARGPAGLLAASTGNTVLDQHALLVPLSDDLGDTELSLAADRRVAGCGIAVQREADIKAAWASRLAGLPMVPVRIPCAERLVFPAVAPQHRIEQRWLLSLAAASARLNHHHRARLDGSLIATEDDLILAIRTTAGLIGRVDHGLSCRAREAVDLIAGRTEHRITIPELTLAKPQWSRQQMRSTIEELLHAGLLVQESAGRGKFAHPFRLVPGASTPTSSICIRAIEDREVQPEAGNAISSTTNMNRYRA